MENIAIKGCAHNIERVIIYPKKCSLRGRDLIAGDSIRLECPHGCADIFFMVGFRAKLKKSNGSKPR